MSGFVTVWLECRSDSARRTFEEMLAPHRAFLIKQTGGPATVDVVCVELDEINPERTLTSIKGLLGKNPALEIFLTAGSTDSQVMLEAFRIGIKEFLPQPINRKEFDAALGRLKERLKSKEEFLAITACTICPGSTSFKPSSIVTLRQFTRNMLLTDTRLHISIRADRNDNSNEVKYSLLLPTPLVKKIFVGLNNLVPS